MRLTEAIWQNKSLIRRIDMNQGLLAFLLVLIVLVNLLLRNTKVLIASAVLVVIMIIIVFARYGRKG